MRFQAPARGAVSAAFLAHPIAEGFPHLHSLLKGDWPDLATLNALLGAVHHPISGAQLHFVPQTRALQADGLHYEARIFHHGAIATRAQNWHDLFNAVCWLDRHALKCAVNHAYVQELEDGSTQERSRRQAALTHFDEAGAVVITRNAARLAAWDAHDWESLFLSDRGMLGRDFRLCIFGHALLEHCLEPAIFPVAKCLVLAADPALPAEAALPALARAIACGRVLADPQELRPLPLAGFPGWHPRNDSLAFYREAPCFRPLRPGRRYPPPWPASRECNAP